MDIRELRADREISECFPLVASRRDRIRREILLEEARCQRIEDRLFVLAFLTPIPCWMETPAD